ncbi:hypothetical protein ATCVBr0604L_522L [Acanthocystis turfacea Chlorella virus Br0604L]|nr:hypothetical protein ATCVBr0604L_522L [Acanthocystis turfacea Chlorella virus Br0604L]AGE59789.1 hypothetical protein ATCVTN60342_524L [Acanthocystis turfacea Chlorella virus TN603.4.2]
MAMYVLAALLLIVIVLFAFWQRKEMYFSRDLAYDRANAVLWTRYKANAVKGVNALDAEAKNVYKYPGYGDYTGMMCRGPNNFRCTTYNNLPY